jgi:hypothetical protein
MASDLVGDNRLDNGPKQARYASKGLYFFKLYQPKLCFAHIKTKAVSGPQMPKPIAPRIHLRVVNVALAAAISVEIESSFLSGIV